jgi:glycosyltransferase involved in cell wall biosynthesis
MPRLAVLADFPEEGWPSMDLVAEQLLAHLPASLPGRNACPPFRRLVGGNPDRAFNRFVRYPRHVRRRAEEFDLFHVADHSYAHLAAEVPVGRCGVFCHDLDAFGGRRLWHRVVARRLLHGLRRAAVVFHGSARTGDELRATGWVDAGTLVHAPYGVAAEFTPHDDGEPPAWLRTLDGPWVLHAGSCIPRKRIDVLLAVMAALPGVTLVQVGGTWTAGQRGQIARGDLSGRLLQFPGVTRRELAHAYRRAGAVLLTSDAEGFGLPVIEGLACGAVVVASDLPVLREVGGPAAVFAPVADVPAWAAAVQRVLTDPCSAPPRADRLAWVARYSWHAHADTIAAAYLRLWEAR